MIKVLHVINSLSAGGAERLVSEIVPLMNEEGFKVDILLLGQAQGIFIDELKSKGINVISFNAKLYSFSNVVKLSKYYKNYDIVHSHLFPSLYWVALAKLARPFANRKVKLIATEHNNKNRRFGKPHFRPIDKFIYSQFSELIAISHKVYHVLSSWIERKDVNIIYNGVNLSRINSAHKTVLPQHKKNILMVASFTKQKDQATLIRAVQRLDESYHLYFAGDGPTKNDNIKLSKELGLEDRVHFLGIRNDVPSLMKTVDLNILSSNFEGLSCVVLESMAAGVPFLGADVEGINDLISNPKGLFARGNDFELSEKIKSILNDSTIGSVITEENLAEVKKYDIHNMVDDYLALYESCMGVKSNRKKKTEEKVGDFV